MRSVLDDLGEEVNGIVAPVSICMALTVALVRILNPDGSSSSNAVFLASAYYTEQEGDSTGQKLSGALINSLIFIGVVAAMTAVLVLLFKYGYTKWIYAYMGLAGFSIFFVLAGIIAIELLQAWSIHLDWVSFTYILFNFAMVGSLTLFFMPAPLFMKQCYLVVTGVVTAYVFTFLPEWTTWILLVAMAVYDIVAVLMPGGPLKILVELAQEREETIPALVYEARPTRRAGGAAPDMQPVPAAAVAPAEQPAAAAAPAERQQELTRRAASTSRDPIANIRRHSVASTAGSSVDSSAEAPLIPGQAGAAAAAAAAPLEQHGGLQPGTQEGAAGQGMQQGGPAAAAPQGQQQREREDDEDSMFGLPDSIKLGLGLCCTLIWLAMARKALPALPFSIALGVLFYFTSRYVLEPVILPMTLELVYF